MDTDKVFPPGTLNIDEKATDTLAQSQSTSSVNSLISHNQDLASRLNVAISRNIELEKNLNRFKKVYAQYEERFQSAKDQVSIYREKEKFYQNESQGLKQKLQLTEAHLHQEKKEALETKETLTKELESLKPYVQEYRKLKKTIESEYLPERDLLKQKAKEEAQRLERSETEKEETLKKLAEASSHIQSMATDFAKTKEELLKHHLIETETLKKKLDEVQTENIVLSDRNRSLRKEQIENTELLNRIEEVKKEKEICIKQGQEEKDNLLLQLSKYKQENDRVKIENHDLKKQWSKTQSDFRSYKKSKESDQNEVESLRALWQEKSAKQEQSSVLNESLNAQLKESESKLTQLIQSHTETKQRLNFFFEQLENIMSKQSSTDQKTTEAMQKAFRKSIEPLLDFDYNF